MHAIIWAFLRRKLMEASTYAGLVGLLGSWLYKTWGVTLTPDEQNTLIASIIGLMGVLMTLISERKGANPANALPPPPGTSPLVSPTAGNGHAAIVLRPDVIPDGSKVVPVSAKPPKE